MHNISHCFIFICFLFYYNTLHPNRYHLYLIFYWDYNFCNRVHFDYTHDNNVSATGFVITDSAGNNLGFTPTKTNTRVVKTVDLSKTTGNITVTLGVSFGSLNPSSMYRTTSVYKIWLEP